MSVYDETSKLWRHLEQEPFGVAEKWSGQHVLNKLLLHNSKVAQVIGMALIPIEMVDTFEFYYFFVVVSD